MRLAQKIIIIIAVLVAPILVFLFLKQFGENEFNLPVYFEEGNPLPDCNSSQQPHQIDLSLFDQYQVQLPALVGFYTTASNEFSSDFENVMQKYPAIDLVQFSANNSTDQVNIPLDSAVYSNLLNCELVMGEDRFIEEAIPHKVVMIDVDGRIRGYFMLNDLEEIERLDIELDILLNY